MQTNNKNMSTPELIFLVIAYIVSVIGAFNFFQHAHYHKQGRWLGLGPDIASLFMIFIPPLNLVFSIGYLLDMWKDDEYRDVFKPKNPLK